MKRMRTPFRPTLCWSDVGSSICLCHRCWTCKRKMKYRTREIANNVALRATRRTNSWIGSYGCKYCFQFHIGHLRRNC